MTRCGRLLVVAGIAPVLALTPALAATPQAGAAQARSASARSAPRPWMNRGQSPQSRAKELVAHMTLAEKITELHGIQDAQHRRYVPGISRLGIPPLVITNGPAGVGPGDDPQQQPATALSAPISLAASLPTAPARPPAWSASWRASPHRPRTSSGSSTGRPPTATTRWC